MSKTQFQDGETIFREDEPSRSAFVIVEGEVELTKESAKGPMILAVLKPGEMIAPRDKENTKKLPFRLKYISLHLQNL